MLLACPQDLAAKYVADTTRHLLVEQGFGDQSIGLAVPTQGIDRCVQIGTRSAQVRATAAEAWMAMGVELSVGLDNSSTEAHGDEVVDSDADTQLRRWLAPRFACPVQIPCAAEEQIGVQDQTVIPDDVELLAVTFDELDHTSGGGGRTIETGCLEAQQGPTY